MSSSGFTIRFNGEERSVCSATVAELLDELKLSDKRIAVELNRNIIRRDKYADTALSSGDAIEIVQFVGGG